MSKWYELLNPGWEEHFVQLDTGIHMCYVTMGPEDGEKMVLVPGMLDTRVAWYDMAPMLAEAGFRVIIVEQRGHGRTEGVIMPDRKYTMEIFADDLISFLDKLGIEKCHFAAHSMGTLVLQVISALHPERVLSMTLISTGPGPNTELFEWLKGELENGLSSQFLDEWCYTEHENPNFGKALRLSTEETPLESWEQCVNGSLDYDGKKYLANLKTDAQIIYGTADTSFTKESQNTLISLITTEINYTYIQMTGRSHNPHWDSKEDLAFVVNKIIEHARS